ncbi:oleate hydratase [Candidatus Galacturonibacter soehngenii]|uniref:Oleate hydratase n=1 Tax=Candidatus Galacturonatibacter soehngenii TaxID=2307010 RepID=A0A7V7UDK1_9FIRM|nr:oleate hydratase [Candidatus Galacturonibacter soehngenii]KAB1441030.1 oleate hydratase [Candidatus Galacturonibacter soehngenii]
MDKKAVKTIAASASAAATVAAILAVKKNAKNQEIKKAEDKMKHFEPGERKAYFVGAGLSSMAGAAYLIRDCNFKGENITIFEGKQIIGGSNDGMGTPKSGFVCRGGRMLNEDTYENFWELFSTIPSLDNSSKNVTEEIISFDHAHPTYAKARLIDKDGKIVDVKSMGFQKEDRIALGKLMVMSEDTLDDMTIQDWFKNTPHFFETNFWLMWQTTFSFQKWSSLLEFKRYIERMILEFSRLETLEGVTWTPYNQYDSVILPIKQFLQDNGVNFITDCVVTDIDFKDDSTITATTLHLKRNDMDDIILLKDEDLCFMTNGCMTDCSCLGNYTTPAKMDTANSMSADLWSKVAKKKKGLGDPTPFFTKPEETNWESFTITCRSDKLIKLIENLSGNIPGSGALMTFKDSNWLLSIVVTAQPHFKNQPIDEFILWGYGLYTGNTGNYVQKPMRDCTGEEILDELLYHLHLQEKANEIKADIVNVFPCMMPYVSAQFQPRKMSDRPMVVPANSTNFAMIGQFVEIPEDIVFTEEYSVRAARIAVYKLLGLPLVKICPVTPHKKDPIVLVKALKTAYR